MRAATLAACGRSVEAAGSRWEDLCARPYGACAEPGMSDGKILTYSNYSLWITGDSNAVQVPTGFGSDFCEQRKVCAGWWMCKIVPAE